MAAPPNGTSSDIGEVRTPEQRLTTLAHLLDCPLEDVVEAVEALLDFNDHSSAAIIRGELDQRDADDRADSMVRALLSDIETAERMLAEGMDSNDLRLILAVLRDRVMLRR
jgi:hypothetical protein